MEDGPRSFQCKIHIWWFHTIGCRLARRAMMWPLLGHITKLAWWKHLIKLEETCPSGILLSSSQYKRSSAEENWHVVLIRPHRSTCRNQGQWLGPPNAPKQKQKVLLGSPELRHYAVFILELCKLWEKAERSTRESGRSVNHRSKGVNGVFGRVLTWVSKIVIIPTRIRSS
jgi:hypothetical protein